MSEGMSDVYVAVLSHIFHFSDITYIPIYNNNNNNNKYYIYNIWLNYVYVYRICTGVPNIVVGMSGMSEMSEMSVLAFVQNPLVTLSGMLQWRLDNR